MGTEFDTVKYHMNDDINASKRKGAGVGFMTSCVNIYISTIRDIDKL
jgi:hypothetical protein